ncbi:winged helix-turn-helix transcriptional regulator [Flavobacterium sp. HJJ]|uniref:winged helix-turn-helix transcriptional regulator n=1 Tax=Flavobacterium sp. HJJ TaxID=2783792 RepID=UPI00188A68E7|nr:helix-turn-helix domain-containing protein [Flavobacterium sp. HJJ]MBF4470604.1 helix-turn-helix transcriptional regulator [Flavobacterium sp. HJJ]
MKEIKKRSDCPISCTLDVFGDKWSLLIIRDMMFRQKSTYGEFLKSEEKIATNILASRLQNLEENKLIEKLEHPESKAKVLYKLTQKAIDLLPIIVEMHLWADKYFEIPADIKVLINEAKKGKEEFIKATANLLKKQISA